MSDVKRSIVLPEEMAVSLDRMAEEQDISFSGLVRRFVRQGINPSTGPKEAFWGQLLPAKDKKRIRAVSGVLGIAPWHCMILAIRKGIRSLRRNKRQE